MLVRHEFSLCPLWQFMDGINASTMEVIKIIKTLGVPGNLITMMLHPW